MDVQLQELIDKIKKDGVASAELNAQKIIAEAEKNAASIVSAAEAKADNIVKTAKVEAERMEKTSEDAIAQAGRNLIISFRDGINKELSALVNAEVSKVYDKDLLKKLIPETVKAWASNTEAQDLSVLLNPKDLKALEDNFKTSLKSYISKGLTIKSDASLSSGFRIGAKDGSAFYDFSAEEVANLFSAYLNPKITEIMKKAAASISDKVEAKTEDANKVSAVKSEVKSETKKTEVKSEAKKSEKSQAEKTTQSSQSKEEKSASKKSSAKSKTSADKESSKSSKTAKSATKTTAKKDKK